MQDGLWICQYKGCQSSPEQIASLRERKPAGFPHDEDSALRVCTVCRRLPLKEKIMEEEDQLDPSFLAGIKEELSSIEESETNVQALSQVFRFYAKHAKKLTQVLVNYVTKECFPWELIHALHLVDDILMLDNSGRYKAELLDRVQAMTVHAFKKVQKEQEKREIAKMLHVWQELRIFDAQVTQAIRSTIRNNGKPVDCKVLDEAEAAADDDELEPVPLPSPTGDDAAEEGQSTAKKQKLDAAPGVAGRAPQPYAAAKPAAEAVGRPATNGRPAVAPAAKANGTSEAKATIAKGDLQKRALALVQRILATPVEKPFEMLGIPEDATEGHDIRKAYRGIALRIHPDKNPGIEVKCQEALIKLQAGREQAETELQRRSARAKPRLDPVTIRGETRSAATAAAANAQVDPSYQCKYPDCDLPPCKQCANGCCTRNITHCHLLARSKGGLHCFFHPPPRAWARNA